MSVGRWLMSFVGAAYLLSLCLCLAAERSRMETRFLPVQKPNLHVTVDAQTSSKWRSVLERGDYQVIVPEVISSVDNQPDDEQSLHVSLSTNSTNSSSNNNHRQVRDGVRRRRSRHVHAAASEECVTERVFWTPMTTTVGDRRVDSPVRVVVKRSPNFGLSDNFQVFHTLPDGGDLNHNDTLTASPRETDSVRHSCFYSGHVNDMTSSLAAVSVIDDYIMGVLQVDEETYIIEPAPSEIEVSSLGGARRHHILYKAAPTTIESDDALPVSSSSHRTRRATNVNSMQQDNGHRQYDDIPYGGQLEVLVVVDKEMIRRHRMTNDVTTYTLAIMNVVASLLSDNSIGRKINVSLIALIQLQDDEASLRISHHAGESLLRFCKWQSSLRHVRHDHAVLITGMDICSYKDAPCDTLGFAPIRGMCNSRESCLISEDTGLGTAFTVAHEIGHSFGMHHDGVNNACEPASGNIMSPTLVGHQGTFKWSPCSRKYLSEFLSSPQAWCILGSSASRSLPVEQSVGMSLKLPLDRLPGELYSALVQCRWQFGAASSTCPFDFARDVCKTLWCYTGERRCETKHLPAAEGTSCGVKRWCRKGTCVLHGSSGPAPIDGGWSEFSSWSECSRTCGGGIAFKERFCNKPRAQFGGKECDGESRIYKLCSTQPCSTDDVSFRAEQCRAFNSREFRGQYYEWLPYVNLTEASDRCRLYCQPAGHRFYFALANKVVDGTRCGDTANDVCIDGVCVRVGCDGIINSGLSLDRCGVCSGDGSSCKRYDVMVVRTTPHFRETTTTSSYDVISLRRQTTPAEAEQTYRWTSGDWLPCSKPCGRGWQKRQVLCFYGDRQIPLPYCEHLPRAPVKRRRCNEQQCRIRWHAEPWSKCSVTCGQGWRHRRVTCRDGAADVILSDNICTRQNLTRPNSTTTCSSKTKDCYIDRRWMLSPWSSCSQTCGRGFRRRSVMCSGQTPDRRWKVLPSVKCKNIASQPAVDQLEEECQLAACHPSFNDDSAFHARWFTSEWRQCDVTCGSGSVQQRLVRCLDDRTGLPSDRCLSQDKPPEVRACSLPPCPVRLAHTTPGMEYSASLNVFDK